MIANRSGIEYERHCVFDLSSDNQLKIIRSMNFTEFIFFERGVIERLDKGDTYDEAIYYAIGEE